MAINYLDAKAIRRTREQALDKVTDQDVYDVAQQQSTKLDPAKLNEIANRWCRARGITASFEDIMTAIQERSLRQLSSGKTYPFVELKISYADPTRPDEFIKAKGYDFPGPDAFRIVTCDRQTFIRFGLQGADQIGGGVFHYDENCEPVFSE
jgi:hypothetical protein